MTGAEDRIDHEVYEAQCRVGIEAWVAEHLGGTVVDMVRLERWRPQWKVTYEAGGETNAVLVRGNRPIAPVEALRFEMEVMQVLEANGILVPHIHGWVDEPAAFVMDWVETKDRAPGMLHTAIDNPSEMDDDRWQAALGYMEHLAAVHAVPVSEFAGVRRLADAADRAPRHRPARRRAHVRDGRDGGEHRSVAVVPPGVVAAQRPDRSPRRPLPLRRRRPVHVPRPRGRRPPRLRDRQPRRHPLGSRLLPRPPSLREHGRHPRPLPPLRGGHGRADRPASRRVLHGRLPAAGRDRGDLLHDPGDPGRQLDRRDAGEGQHHPPRLRGDRRAARHRARPRADVARLPRRTRSRRPACAS